MKHREGLKRFISPPIANTLRFILALLVVVISMQSILTGPVFAAPVITASPLPFGQVNSPYFGTLTATVVSGNSTVPLTGTQFWAVTAGSLPPGLGLTATNGIISGLPTTAGTFPFFVTVTHSTGTSPQQYFTITITPPPFNITTTTLPQGKEGTAYSASLSASGGTTPYTWSIISGSLPSGLVLQPTTGAITGTPSRGTVGTSSFTIGVTDSSSSVLSSQMSFSIYIEKGLFQSTVTVNSNLKAGNTKVYVNGTTASTLKGGEYITLSFDLGITRTITVDPLVTHPTDPGVRFKVQQESVTISELQPNAEFNYYAEYFVDVKVDPSINIQPQGSGWYRQGTPITVSTKADTQGNTGVMYKFAYWLFPSTQKVTTEQVNFTVDNPATLTAYYDTYYKLTTESPHGQVEGSGWYKAGSEARWSVINDRVPMEGIIGFFQGKYKAVNPTGSEVMNAPKTVMIAWEPDYTLPYVLIPVVIVVVALVLVGMYFLLRRQQQMQPQPQPMQPFPTYPPPYMPPPPPPPRPIPQQHTTVVMIGDKGSEAPKQLPSSTKEQLMEKFGELLEKYETEIKSTLGPPGAKALPKVETLSQEKMIPGPQSIPPQSVVDGEFTSQEGEEQFCQYASKKLRRTVASDWKQLETDTIALPSEAKTGATGLLVVWARDIYQEWEILTCSLPLNHEGKHAGDTQIVYSLLNTVTEKKVYSPSDQPQPPTPHFTDGMPQLDISSDQILPADDLPRETTK